MSPQSTPPDPSFRGAFNLAHYFLDARVEEGRGDDLALVAEDETRTYLEVQRRANRVRHALDARRVHREDRVLMLLFDGFEFVETWFGTLKRGAVFCMANPLSTTEEIEYLLDYTRARVVVADAEVVPRLAPLLARYPECRVRLVVGGEGAPPGWEAYEDALGGAPDVTDNAETEGCDVAGWLFTSGTTGRPKGAVHLHRHFAYHTEVFAKQTLGLRASDVFVSVSRLFFGYGTGTNLMFPFAVGARCVLFRAKPTPELLFEQIARFGVTVLTNVPAMIRRMVDCADAPALPSLRMCLSAGEALPPSLSARWAERWPRAELLDGIGSAEMFHIYISNRPGDVKPGSLGRLVSGFRVRIVGPDGEDVAPGEIGRLWVAGETTALCYWRRQDASRETFRGEWCMTADLFRQDASGYFYYEGRVDDMLKVRGQFVSPLEIEEHLSRHPAVRECAVVGVDDGHGLTVPKAVVALREGHAASPAIAEALKAHVRERLSAVKCPRVVEFTAALPRNDRGKVVRRQLS